jgi:hypothetical protein
MIDLIVCTGGNRKYWQIVADSGLLNGAQLPDTVYGSLYFADQDYRRPNKQNYLCALDQHRPTLATVLDWESHVELSEVLDWASQAAAFVQTLVIIPKVNQIDRIPETIEGKPVRLGYAVPTSHGTTDLPIEAFCGWHGGVHLLGGNPLRQLELRGVPGLDIRSVDCNQIMLKANRWAQFLQFRAAQMDMFGGLSQITTRWKQLKHIGLGGTYEAPSKALELSCLSLKLAWSS